MYLIVKGRANKKIVTWERFETFLEGRGKPVSGRGCSGAGWTSESRGNPWQSATNGLMSRAAQESRPALPTRRGGQLGQRSFPAAARAPKGAHSDKLAMSAK